MAFPNCPESKNTDPCRNSSLAFAASPAAWAVRAPTSPLSMFTVPMRQRQPTTRAFAILGAALRRLPRVMANASRPTIRRRLERRSATASRIGGGAVLDPRQVVVIAVARPDLAARARAVQIREQLQQQLGVHGLDQVGVEARRLRAPPIFLLAPT